MKKTLLAGLFALMGMFASAETKINVTQSIRYGNGSFATMDTPQISREKARKEGGKVYLRYDFEVKKGFMDVAYSDIYIAIRFPTDSSENADESRIKVTALSGAKDARMDVLDDLKEDGFNYEVLEQLERSIGRFPTANNLWFIERYNVEKGSSSIQTEFMEAFEGIDDEVIHKAYLRLVRGKSPMPTA